MAEYIDREVFKKSVEEYYCKPCKAEGKDHNGCWCRACWVDDMLDEIDCFQPAADVAPVVHGQWIIGADNDDFDVKCSKCEWTDTFEVAGIAAVERIAKSMHYCPNCGAKMEEVSE